MALIFMDGFDHYATADITKKWNTTSGSFGINTTGGRSGGGAFIVTSTTVSGWVGKSIAAGASFIFGVRYSTSAYPSSSTLVPLIRLHDSTATVQCEMSIASDGTLVISRNGTTLTSTIAGTAIGTNAFNYIEFKISIASSITANSCQIRVNGALVFNATAGQNTKNATNATATQFRLGHVAVPGQAGTALFDDFYVCDPTGTTNYDFLGDVRIDTIMPNADGSYSAFVPNSGTTHYTQVRESTPDATTYNDGANVGDRDSYQLADLPSIASQTIYGVQVSAAVQKDDAGARSAGLFIRSGGSNKDGAAAALSTSQVYASQVFETDPSGAAFTQTSVNAMEAGVLVTA